MKQQQFKKGDRVRLIAPFRHRQDDEDEDADFDADLREYSIHGAEVLGTVEMVETLGDGERDVLVNFDVSDGAVKTLWCNADVLGPELEPPTEDEIRAAIESIQGSR